MRALQREEGDAMLISDLINTKGRDVTTLPGSARLANAAKLMTAEGIGAVVVVDARGGLDGLIAERDIVLAVTAAGGSALRDSVWTWMRQNVPTVGPEARILDAINLITAARARHLPVVAAGKVVGLLSVGDLLTSRLDEKTQENLILREVARWPESMWPRANSDQTESSGQILA
jgi:CBS domain-containing protein